MATPHSTLEVANVPFPFHPVDQRQHSENEGLEVKHLYGDAHNGKEVALDTGIQVVDEKEEQTPSHTDKGVSEDLERADGVWKRLRRRRACGMPMHTLIVLMLLVMGAIAGTLGGILPRVLKKAPTFHYPEPNKWYRLVFDFDGDRPRNLQAHESGSIQTSFCCGDTGRSFAHEREQWQFIPTYQQSPDGTDLYFIYNRNYTEWGRLATLPGPRPGTRKFNFTDDLLETDTHTLWSFSPESDSVGVSKRKDERMIKNGNGTPKSEYYLGHAESGGRPDMFLLSHYKKYELLWRLEEVDNEGHS